MRDVLALWSGLGYNRRALALQRAAAHVAEHGWPSDLTELPGVGKYTAAAVSSFAWDRDMAAVDTNVRRVLTRREGDVDVAARADELLPRGRAGVVQPGDDGAGRDRLPPSQSATARGARSSAAACAWSSLRLVASRPRNSRTPIDGRAGA